MHPPPPHPTHTHTYTTHTRTTELSSTFITSKPDMIIRRETMCLVGKKKSVKNSR